MAKKGINDVFKCIISIVACQLAGVIGAIFSTPAISGWYAGLNKPVFSPPNWLFAPAWITLYLLMAIAAFLVWRKGLDSKNVRIALIVFLVQLVLNILWSVTFFGLKSLVGAVVIIVLLWIAILITIIRFFKVSIAAGWLMVPYILWVTFASSLSVAVWLLNP